MLYRTLILICLCISGCASQQLTEEEREWRQGIDAENWYMCKRVYQQAGQPTYSKHTHRKHEKHRPDQVREDLMLNNCRRILDDYWADY